MARTKLNQGYRLKQWNRIGYAEACCATVKQSSSGTGAKVREALF